LSEAIAFYAPDWELVLIWCAIAIPTCVAVFWVGRLFGRRGALTAGAIFIAVAAGLLILLFALGPGLHRLFGFMFPPPLIVGAVAGLALKFLFNGARPPCSS
jgi:hypothetical protein